MPRLQKLSLRDNMLCGKLPDFLFDSTRAPVQGLFDGNLFSCPLPAMCMSADWQCSNCAFVQDSCAPHSTSPSSSGTQSHSISNSLSPSVAVSAFSRTPTSSESLDAPDVPSSDSRTPLPSVTSSKSNSHTKSGTRSPSNSGTLSSQSSLSQISSLSASISISESLLPQKSELSPAPTEDAVDGPATGPSVAQNGPGRASPPPVNPPFIIPTPVTCNGCQTGSTDVSFTGSQLPVSLNLEDGGGNEATVIIPENVVPGGDDLGFDLAVSYDSGILSVILTRSDTGEPITSLNEPIELCLGELRGEDTNDVCLGFFDEETGDWECEDCSVQHRGASTCGQTDHLTNFAILLNSNDRSQKCETDSDLLFAWLSLGFVLAAIILIIIAIALIELWYLSKDFKKYRTLALIRTQTET